MKKSLIFGFFLIAMVIVGVGCAVRPLMDLSYVSTKARDIDTNQGTLIAPVESDVVFHGEDGLGVMETAVNNALAKAGTDAKYLKNAVFAWKKGGLFVKGDAYK